MTDTDNTKDKALHPESSTECWSVSDILMKKDELRLAVVQRSPVWREEQVARFLDSLLRGYPVGCLLFVKTRDLPTCKLLDYDPDRGRLYDGQVSNGEALLDGQQRILAIYSLFDGWRGADFRLNMVAPIPPADLANLKTRSQKDRLLRKRVWWAEPGRDEPPDGAWLQLRTISEHLVELKQIADSAGPESEKLESLLNILVPNRTGGFARDDTEKRNAAEEMVTRLLRLLFRKVIPVRHVQLDNVSDVLHVYSRLNLEGTPVSQDDVFFAAVKTLWQEADSKLTSLCKTLENLVDPTILLRALARMACVEKSNGEHDLLPLRANRLNGSSGAQLIEATKKLANCEDAQERWKNWAAAVKKELGYATNYVNPHAWDLVLAHVAWSKCEINEDYVKATVSFMLGTTAFRYYTVFRNDFASRAMREIYKHRGHDGFPQVEIANMCKETWPYAQKGTSRLWSEAEWQEVVNGSAYLFLSIAQGLKANAVGFDWDHIFPRAGKRYMLKKEESEGRRRPAYAEFHDRVGWAGNLSAVPSSVNRQVRDRLPDEKLNEYSKCVDQNEVNWDFADGQTVAAKMAMTDEERRQWSEVAKSLRELGKERSKPNSENYNHKLAEIMCRFKDSVESRQARIWQVTEERYGISAYASWSQNAADR